MNEKQITRFNGVEIAAVTTEDGNIFVPVKPICQALTIDFEGQRQRIARHYILGSVAFALKAPGADGKAYEMICLPLEYIYGWLFTIDAGLVAESRREAVANYQRECYNALYEHFAGNLRRQIETNEAEIAALKEVNAAIADEKEAKARRKKAEEHLAKVRAARFDETPTLFS